MENLWMVGFASLGTDGVITVGAASPHTSGGTVFQEYNEFAAVTNSGFSTPFMFVYTVASPLATW